MRGNRHTIGFIWGIGPALLCATSTFAAAETIANETIQASGGLTLGSVVLVALAGAIATFSRSKTRGDAGIHGSGD